MDENLPDSVCIPCFKIIRIAYNFLLQFKESQERLLIVESNQVHLEDKKVSTNAECCEAEESNFTENYASDSSTETNYITYNLEKIHSYAQKNFEQDTTVEMASEVINQLDVKEFINSHESDDIIPPDSSNSSDGIFSNSIEKINVSEATVPNKISVSNSDTPCVNVYTCPICKSEFVRLQKFNDHVSLHKANIIVCNKCPRPIKLNMSQYIKHYKEHHRYQCNLCGKSLTSSYGFRYHMKQHENDRKYVCPIKDCSKSYFLHNLLKRHMVSHSKAMRYKCNLCETSFKNYDTYKYHLKTHDGKRDHLCTQCGKAFFQAVHLRDHMFRHAGHKQFTCHGCGRSFTTNSQLKKHFRHCHP